MTELKTGAGRPTKLTPETQEKICQAVRAGNYYVAACEYAGISQTTFCKWMNRGEQEESGIYTAFVEAVKRAEREAEVRMVAQWQQHMPENWQAIATFLERRYPERWGRKQYVVEHSGTMGVNHGVAYDKLSDILTRDPASVELAKQLLRRQDELTAAPPGSEA